MKECGKMRLKQAIYESTRAPLCGLPFPIGKAKGGGFAAPKGSQPRLAALGSPFQGKGLAWILPPSYGRRCPEGAEVGWGKRDEKRSGGDRLKCAVYESTLSTAARSPFPNGEGCDTRIPLFSHRQSEYRIRGEKNNEGQSLPREGKVASGASRIGY